MKINQDVFIQEGILDYQIDQLIGYSQTDSQVKEFTSDSTRFANKDAFHHWQQQGRIIYTLIDKSKNSLGIIWFGQKNPQLKNIQANYTFAIRIYSIARGHGLSFEFMETAFKDLSKNQKESSHITGFWLETAKNNLAAIHLYQNFGFKTISEQDGRAIMVLEK